MQLFYKRDAIATVHPPVPFWEDFCNYILNLLTYFTFQKLLNLI